MSSRQIYSYHTFFRIRFRYSTISYVQQTPWLMKASIRDNIIFGEPFRPRRYEKVLLSCCLKQDIDLMPDGDMTEIGTNGLNLSGGQRQRITIARALYSSANVVIMVKSLNSHWTRAPRNFAAENKRCKSQTQFFTQTLCLFVFLFSFNAFCGYGKI